MVKVEMEKLCGCAKRNGIKQIQEFSDKESALKEANELVSEMNETFCQKHSFAVVENSDTQITIKMSSNR
jgi:hypothetical protein